MIPLEMTVTGNTGGEGRCKLVQAYTLSEQVRVGVISFFQPLVILVVSHCNWDLGNGSAANISLLK